MHCAVCLIFFSGIKFESTSVMKIVILILLLISLVGHGQAQVSKPAPADTLSVLPGTMRVTGQVVSSEKNTAVIKVLEVTASGAGITNVLSAGQTLTVRVSDDRIKLVPGENIEADLRQKIGADAALSTYTLLRTRKPKG